jgi:hypothetical protein
MLPDDMLIRVVILANDRKLLHVEAALLEFANSVFRAVVRCKDSDNGILLGYNSVPHWVTGGAGPKPVQNEKSRRGGTPAGIQPRRPTL